MAEHIDRPTPRDPTRENNLQLPTAQPRNTIARPFDDLIVSLANAHENRRARQVTEWERMRRQYFPLSV